MKGYSASIACILAGDGARTGSGIVIDHNRILTCAHVVLSALGHSPEATKAPEEHIFASVPLRGGGDKKFRMQVQPRYWLPKNDQPQFGEAEDLAVLRLVGESRFPASVVAANLADLDLQDDLDRRVALTGFPGGGSADRITGLARGLDDRGRLQIDPERFERGVSGGFSGAGILDIGTGLIVGLMVTRRNRGGVYISYGTPVSSIIRSVDLPHIVPRHNQPAALPHLPRNYVVREDFLSPLRNNVLRGSSSGVVAGARPTKSLFSDWSEPLLEAPLNTTHNRSNKKQSLGLGVPGGTPLAIKGMGGLGKSVLAKAVRGLQDRNQRDPLNFSPEEWQQAKRTRQDPKAIKEAMREAWVGSDNRQSFEAAIQERGFSLAKGDSCGFVAVDWRGEIYSVSRGTGIKTKDLQSRLGDPEELPSTDEAKIQLSERMTPKLKTWAEEAQEKAHQENLSAKYQREQMVQRQRHLRAQLETEQKERWQSEEQIRADRTPSGLRGLWGWITGRNKIVREQNETEIARATERDRAEKQAVIDRQLTERQRLKAQSEAVREEQRKRIDALNKDIAHYMAIGGVPPRDVAQRFAQQSRQPTAQPEQTRSQAQSSANRSDTGQRQRPKRRTERSRDTGRDYEPD